MLRGFVSWESCTKKTCATSPSSTQGISIDWLLWLQRIPKHRWGCKKKCLAAEWLITIPCKWKERTLSSFSHGVMSSKFCSSAEAGTSKDSPPGLPLPDAPSARFVYFQAVALRESTSEVEHPDKLIAAPKRRIITRLRTTGARFSQAPEAMPDSDSHANKAK